MKRFLILFLIACLSAFGVDSLTVDSAGGQLSKIDWTWTSDGSGNASGVTTTVVPGIIYSVSTTPDTSNVPSDNYDVVIQNQVTGVNGSAVVLATDRAGGLLANRDSVNTELVELWPAGVYTVQGKIKISVSNAGNAKSGRIVVTFHRNLAVTGFSGAVSTPVGSTLGNLLQWSSPGVPKWVAASGDVTLADGGAFTIANGAVTPAKTSITGTPTGAKYLRDDWTWQSTLSTAGDVFGPASATNNGIVLFDTTTGKLIKDSTYTFPLADAQVSDTLTASKIVGSGSTTDAVDLATAEVSGTLPAASVGNGLTDTQVDNGLTIDGGTINNSVIGGSTPAAGTFTTVTTTGNVKVGDAAGDALRMVRNTGGATSDVLRIDSATDDLRILNPAGKTYISSSGGTEIIRLAFANESRPVFNANQSASGDFAVHGSALTNLLFVDSDESLVSMSGALSATGAITGNGNWIIGSDSADTATVNATVSAPWEIILSTNATEVGNVGSGEDDLMSYSVPAGKLATNKDSVSFHALLYIKSGETGRFRVYFGSTAFYDTSTIAASADVYIHVYGQIIRTGAATQIAYAQFSAAGTGIQLAQYAAPTQTLSGAVTMKITGESSVTPADNDVKQPWMTVSYAKTP